MAARRVIAIAAGTALLLAAPAAAQETAAPPPDLTGLELTAPVQQRLLHLQEHWLQWMSAFFQNSPARAEAALQELLVTARDLGFPRLPDLALGAAARAVQSAREGNFERAAWALDAAERLDPGRPETAFAAAIAARRQGDWGRSAARQVAGYLRLARLPLQREIWLQQAALWAALALLLAGALFVALQMAAKGGGLVRDLRLLLARPLPAIAGVATIVLLLWPLALPAGLLGVVLLWSALLWSYGSPSERALLVAIWLLVGSVPLLVSAQQRRLATTLAPPARAIEQLAQRRLSGSLFTNLAALRASLPESPAVRQLLGDVHRRLGQWEQARAFYVAVLEVEPQNTAALIDLGAYYFRKGDHGRAIELFQRAATADPQSAAAFYDLSQAYSQSYLFTESRQALSQARDLDEALVSRWIQRPDPDRVQTIDGGLQRAPEIRRLLAAQRRQATGPPSLDRWRRIGGLPVAVLLTLGAVAFDFWRRRVPRPGVPALPQGGALGRWARALLPGLAAAEAGDGWRGFEALLAVAALAILPLMGRLGYRIPWGLDPGNGLVVAALVIGFGLFFGRRVRRARRG